MAAVIKHAHRLLQGRQAGLSWLQRRYLFHWYNKQEGVPIDFLVWLQKDYDITLPGLKRSFGELKMMMLKDSQQYLPERHKILGPDLATAHFIVKRGGSVKFVGREMWFKMDENGKYYVPNRRVEGMLIEAVDASNTSLMYDGLDNLVDLHFLRYLVIRNCKYIDDWCLSRLQRYSDTLEFLDISGCRQVTDDGLASLHHLRKLKALKIANLANVKHKELMALLIEEAVPECRVFGVDATVEEQNQVNNIKDRSANAEHFENHSNQCPETQDEHSNSSMKS